MENRFKLHLSKLLQSTFNSCRPKTNSDVSDHRPSPHKNPKDRRLIDLFSPKPHPLPSRFQTPPFPSNTIPHSVHPIHNKTSKTYRKKKLNCRRRRNNATFSSITDNYYYSNWWSSEEDNQSDGKTTLFSRRSVSSDSIESGWRMISGGGKGGGGDSKATGVVGLDGFAISKDSSDPYEDFRGSMVDMIVEKEMFGVEELESLVESFLSLNSEEHHKVIVEVFAEIWETLVADSYKNE